MNFSISSVIVSILLICVLPLVDGAKLLLKTLVERYIADGQPVGSRTLSKASGLDLSPATIRNAMADLEDAGLLYAPHTSAGRLPTERGLRLFVDGLLEFGALGEDDRDAIAARCAASGRPQGDRRASAAGRCPFAHR